MIRRSAMHDPLLKSVSRSFHLTLRLLPKEVRATLSLAYLLARASDSIADACSTAADARLEWLRGLPEKCPDFRRQNLTGLPFGELALLHALPPLLRELDASPDAAAIRAVWRTILAGQIFDLERFSEKTPLTPGELARYTYLVAGCVGEFWTDLCFKRTSGYSDKKPDEMRALGIRFGQGLQLVNILRDRRADAVAGRVYVVLFEAEMQHARGHLAAAAQYVSAIRPRRLRAACALPLILGRQTLDIIGRHPSAAGIKVSRRDVWIAFLRAIVC